MCRSTRRRRQRLLNSRPWRRRVSQNPAAGVSPAERRRPAAYWEDSNGAARRRGSRRDAGGPIVLRHAPSALHIRTASPSRSSRLCSASTCRRPDRPGSAARRSRRRRRSGSGLRLGEQHRLGHEVGMRERTVPLHRVRGVAPVAGAERDRFVAKKYSAPARSSTTSSALNGSSSVATEGIDRDVVVGEVRILHVHRVDVDRQHRDRADETPSPARCPGCGSSAATSLRLNCEAASA